MENPGKNQSVRRDSSAISFSSGPCAKRHDWNPPTGMFAGRSHRSSIGLSYIQEILTLQRKILKIPDDYFVAIVGGSSTGAVESLLWSMLGANGIDVLAQCVFSNHWANDISNELKLSDVRILKSDMWTKADVESVNFNRDVVFCWTSTTSGVSFQNGDWINSNRNGLTICDASSAVFSYDLPWDKLDATAFSWQKGIGSEAGFGTIVLSAKAIARLETYIPPWPIPRLFRIANNGNVNFDLFNGYLINTPSMLCLEDFRDSLMWADEIGGIESLKRIVEFNYQLVKQWISTQDLFYFLVDERHRAHQIICLGITDEKYQRLSTGDKWEFLKKIVEACEIANLGCDFLGHVLTEPHLRIWIGPTVEHGNLERLLLFLESAYNSVSIEF